MPADQPLGRTNILHSGVQGDVESGMEETRKAISSRPNDPQLHCRLGDLMLEKGDFAGAITEYRRAAEIDPDLTDAHHHWGIALKVQGDDAGAIEKFKKVVQIKPDHADAYQRPFSPGRTYCGTGAITRIRMRSTSASRS